MEKATNEQEPTSGKAFIGQLTSNNRGAMFEHLDEFAELGLRLLENRSNPTAIDIGCAFGYVTKQILSSEKNKNIKVIANDIGQEHLDVLRESLVNEPDKLARLELKFGSILETEFEPESLDAVFALRVFHYFTGVEVREIFGKLFRSLKSGGCLVVTCASPFNWCFDEDFSSTFKKREAEGREWPGEISADELKKYVLSPKVLNQMPERLHTFTAELLIREATRAGFNVLKSGYANRVTNKNEAPVYKTKNDYACLVAVKGMFN